MAWPHDASPCGCLLAGVLGGHPSGPDCRPNERRAPSTGDRGFRWSLIRRPRVKSHRATGRLARVESTSAIEARHCRACSALQPDSRDSITAAAHSGCRRFATTDARERALAASRNVMVAACARRVALRVRDAAATIEQRTRYSPPTSGPPMPQARFAHLAEVAQK
jgi:hypothetical protein